jgi:hypothetical protein
MTVGTSVIADGISIIWEQYQIPTTTTPSTSTSMPNTTTTTTSTSTSITDIATTAVAITSSTTPTNTSVPSTGGLSHGGRIGVGVGIPVGMIIIGCILGFWFYKRYQSRKNDISTKRRSNVAQAISEPPEKENVKYELHGRSAPQELDG